MFSYCESYDPSRFTQLPLPCNGAIFASLESEDLERARCGQTFRWLWSPSCHGRSYSAVLAGALDSCRSGRFVSAMASMIMSDFRCKAC